MVPILKVNVGEIQADVAKRLGDRLATKVGDKKTPFDLVMHGGSGSTAEEIFRPR